MKLITYLRTTKQLGWRNCIFVLLHRIALRAGFYERSLPMEPCPVPEVSTGYKAALFSAREIWFHNSRQVCLVEADGLLAGQATWFSHERFHIGSPPEWFLDPASGQRFPDASNHWSKCRPFGGADIKRCWELSRWGWAPLLARAWRLTGDVCYRDASNDWIKSWCLANPVNGGSNWLCGQEVSMRLLHALQAWQLCDAPARLPYPTHLRAAFAAAHLQRIAATERYAQAQDNNHWTSEAAALFIGGSWLAVSTGQSIPAGRDWARSGRRAIERSVGRLVLADGSFAQHSVTYHRLVLDTLAQVEVWRRWLDLKPFTKRFYERCRVATAWLEALVDPISGHAPNLGSNDGAFCYQLHSLSYRDFRPTLQLASKLFLGHPALSSGPWDEPLYWMGLLGDEFPIALKQSPPARPITVFGNGGYGLLRPTPFSWAVLRLPIYRFRPAHADPLHFDLWHQGINLLRDGGSYAYNANDIDLSYFPGIACHNSVQFDGAEPMPRLGRFLWGDWLQLETPAHLELAKNKLSITAAYRCPNGRHQRRVQTSSTGLNWTITDLCSLFHNRLVLRWRLCPSPWQLVIESSSAQLNGPLAQITVECNLPIQRLELVEGWESLLYAQKTSIPVLELELAAASIPVLVTTHISLMA
ncbi:heparinase II/III family protein [bacterium]|nr:heparinase II/III family protein [bacterium]